MDSEQDWSVREEGAPLLPSLQGIAIDDNALWADLEDGDNWKPLREAVAILLRTVGPPGAFRTTLTVGEWNLAQEGVQRELDRLETLLLARRLNERLGDFTWEEPLASLLDGLDFALASVIETGARLDLELNAEVPIQEEASPWDAVDGAAHEEEEAGVPGRGRAYVLFRRYVAELQATLDLLDAVREEAEAEDE